MIQYLNPPELGDYTRFGLSLGAATDRYVFAGAMALDIESRRRMPEADTIADETRICLEALEKIIEEAGCTRRDIVKVTAYLSDDAYRREFWETYKEFFDPGPFPARCTFVVGIAGDCRVELDSVAVRPDGDG